MSGIEWDIIPEHKVLEGVYGKFVHTDKMTIVLWRFDRGADLPAHSHPHEQLTMIQKGRFDLRVGDMTHQLSAGDTIPIASNVPHGGKAIEETIALDVFTPVREDFLDAYE
ncbi:MAG: cupin domain-containing protein [Candidatus Kariarchaeaceae archaeon]|jgi:quercetin dioxygenase-like cupin family protein